MKKVEIRFENGATQATVSIEEPTKDEWEKVFSNLLLFLGMSSKEITEHRMDDIARVYQNFEVRSDITETNEEIELTKEEVAPIQEQPPNEEAPSNIKIFSNEDTYKAKYLCDKCGHKGGRYIKGSVRFVFCHNCNHRMHVVYASDSSTYNNYVANTEGYYFITKNL